MNILGIDTSTKYLGLAVIKNKKLSGRFFQDMGRAHSAYLVPEIKKLLQGSKSTLHDLDAIALSIGPGSFTGLRIGVSTVKGLVFGAKKPVVPVPTMDIIAQNAASCNGKACVIIDARKQQIYACLYDIKQGKPKRVSKYMLLKIDELLKKLDGKILFLGDAIAVYRQEIEKAKKIKPLFADQDLWYPDPYKLCLLAQDMLRARKTASAQELAPMYIYSRECTVTKK